jgi:LysR family hydrogen peroxide-inducible transcriptional activator
MDLQRIRYFLEVARQKNFSKAALVCSVSQPSLSQQIKKLEGEVGGDLFVREHGAVSLTVLGTEFLKHAQAIMAEVAAAEEFVSHSQNDIKRTVYLGAIPTIAPYLVPEIFERIRTHYPSAQFRLLENRTESLIDSLLSGEIDFALLSPPTRIDPECDSILLGNDEFLLTLPAGHPLSKAKSIKAEQLKDEQIILLENSHCLFQQTEAYCEELGLKTDVTLQGSQIHTLLGLVERGFGLTFTPSIASKAHADKQVTFRSIAQHPCSREIRLVWLRRQFLTQSQQAVIDSVQGSHFANLSS